MSKKANIALALKDAPGVRTVWEANPTFKLIDAGLDQTGSRARQSSGRKVMNTLSPDLRLPCLNPSCVPG